LGGNVSGYLLAISISMILVFCSSCKSTGENKSRNPLISLWLPFSSSRTKQVFNHSLVKSHRHKSDCGKICPDVDIWQYKYMYDGELIISDKPIATEEKYWKSPNEARILAISLFDGKEFYYEALLQYLESFKRIKTFNNIHDKVWGYETFTVRVYVSKRNPKLLKELGEIKNRTPDYIVDNLLSLGCEIAFVDNKLAEAKKDGTFWRFAVASEQMPPNKSVRYIVRDADNILTAVEMYAVADWINSKKRYHRLHVTPICFGPMTAMLWGGLHMGIGDFKDFHDLIKNYPYRFEYGDDELFTRDLMWPRLKATGSVLTHHFARRGAVFPLASPYPDSCEEPTQKFCLKLNPNSKCEDRILPKDKNLRGAVEALGLRLNLDDLYRKNPEFFDLDVKNPDRKFIYEAFKGKEF
jgi:hypothetical protein